MLSRTEIFLRLLESRGGRHARQMRRLRLARLPRIQLEQLPRDRAERRPVRPLQRISGALAPRAQRALESPPAGLIERARGLLSLVRLDGVRVSLAMAPFVQRLRQEAGRRGLPFSVVSGYRSEAEKADLFMRWQRGDPSVIFPPAEHSFHDTGDAVDINPIATARALGPFGESIGLRWGGRFRDPRTRRSDDVHFDLGRR